MEDREAGKRQKSRTLHDLTDQLTTRSEVPLVIQIPAYDYEFNSRIIILEDDALSLRMYD